MKRIHKVAYTAVFLFWTTVLFGALAHAQTCRTDIVGPNVSIEGFGISSGFGMFNKNQTHLGVLALDVGDPPWYGTLLLGNLSTDGTGTGYILFKPANTLVAELRDSEPFAMKFGGAQWGALSDGRLKKNVRPLGLGLAEIEKLRPRQFKYNGKAKLAPNDGRVYVGLVAQEVRDAIPALVHEFPVESLDGQPLLSIDSSPLQFVLVNAVKEEARMVQAADRDLEAMLRFVCDRQPHAKGCIGIK